MPRIYLDLDGVIADFHSAACKVHGWSVEDPRVHRYNFFEEMGLNEDEFWKPLDNYDFWMGIPEYRWNEDFVDGLNAIAELTFCSTPSRSSDAHKAKIDWIRSKPWYGGEEILLMANKERLANGNVILIDDNERNCGYFSDEGGTSILFPQYWNSYARLPNLIDVHETIRKAKRRLLPEDEVCYPEPFEEISTSLSLSERANIRSRMSASELASIRSFRDNLTNAYYRGFASTPSQGVTSCPITS